MRGIKASISLLLIGLFIYGHEEKVRVNPIIEVNYIEKLPSKQEIVNEIQSNLQYFPYDVAVGIVNAESNFDSLARNKKSSSLGLSQMLIDTGKFTHYDILHRTDVYNHDNQLYWKYNIKLMCAYLDYLYVKNNHNLRKTIYNYRGKNSKWYYDKVTKYKIGGKND